MTNDMHAGRIHGAPVPIFTPRQGPVHVLLIGEAPGPRGADKSGVPFFGDAAGRVLYDVLVRLGAITLPPEIENMDWDGSLFAARGLVPVARGVALGNAFDRCPTDDGVRFRAPRRSELVGSPNLARLERDITSLRTRGLSGIVTLGSVATRTVEAVCTGTPLAELRRCGVPHPSAQGLLSMAPGRGKGAKMADLQALWMERCRDAVLQAGYPAPGAS